MRILFCDDSQLVLCQLRTYVSDFFSQLGEFTPEYATYTSGDALLAQEKRADMAFLDVEMPGLSGIHVGAQLKKYNPNIKIFIVTSYPDYLDEAMRFQVFRYLSKPIDKNRLFRNLKDAIYQYSMENREYAIVTNAGVFTRCAEEIICVEARNRKVIVYTADAEFHSTQTMEYWRQMLRLPCFYIPHRSYIINMRYVAFFGKDSIRLKSKETEYTAYLTRRKYTSFKDTYLMYLESVK